MVSIYDKYDIVKVNEIQFTMNDIDYWVMTTMNENEIVL